MLLPLIALALCVSSSNAATYYVSPNSNGQSPFTNWATASPALGPAVMLAKDGDDILVAPGSYALTDTLSLTNGAHIIGINGAESTVIRGNHSFRCVSLAHPNAHIEGLTITGGSAAFGAGALLTNGSTISRCLITGNVASQENYYVWGGYGGGIFCASSSMVIDSVVSNNTSSGPGGGIALVNHGMISNCVITANVSHSAYERDSGGGCYVRQNGVILNCMITHNQSSKGGAGIGSFAGCYVSNSIVSDNIGYGMYHYFGGGQVYNTLITRNSEGGVYFEASLTYMNCTITGNSVVGIYADLYRRGGDTPGTLLNCIIYPDPRVIICYDAVCPQFWNNCVTNPGFRNAAAGDYRLRGDSPCRDAGTNLEWMANAVDLDGGPRIVSGRVDIGAYEFRESPKLSYVTNGSTMFQWNVVTGETYQIEATRHLNSANWSNISGVVTASSPVISFSDSENTTIRFYRMVYRPRTVQAQFIYTTNADNTLTICGYTGVGGGVVIPSSIAGIIVASIGDGAFRNCTGLTSLIIPNSVTNIGIGAFQGCLQLTCVIIGNGVNNIESMAFGECSNLTTVVFCGNAPNIVDPDIFLGTPNVTVYFLSETTGWTNPWCGRPTALYQLELPDGLDNNGNGQIDETCRDLKTCFSLNQSIRCEGAGWSRMFVMDLTNSRNLAVQAGYQSYAVDYPLYYNIWMGIYIYDFDIGVFSAEAWLTNLDL